MSFIRYFARTLSIVAISMVFGAHAKTPEGSDPYMWLEELTSERSLTWVEQENGKTLQHFTQAPEFAALKGRFLNDLNQESRMPVSFVTRVQGDLVYRLHQDAEHVRGLLQSKSYTALVDDNIPWETLLDVDALAKKEDKAWYLALPNSLFSPDGKRLLLAMSDGGGDAFSYREFDLQTGTMVSDGFHSPVAKSFPAWEDDNTLILSIALTDEEQSAAGYPIAMRRWKRGTDLQQAPIIAQVSQQKVLLTPNRLTFNGQSHLLHFTLDSLDSGGMSVLYEGRWIELKVPLDVFRILVTGWKGFGPWRMLAIKETMQVGQKQFNGGDIIAVNFPQLIANQGQLTAKGVELVYRPSETQSIASFGGIVETESAVYLQLMEHVNAKLLRFVRTDNGEWKYSAVTLPGKGAVEFVAAQDQTQEPLLKYQGFDTPYSLFSLQNDGQLKLILRDNPSTGLEDLQVQQLFATAKDDTQVPYYVVAKKSAWGNTPLSTMIAGYGGFGLAMTPAYKISFVGATQHEWLRRGGAFVLANVRGGGEYGPEWHLQTKRTNRQIVYDDYYAVAEDLVKRKISSKGRMGFVSGSNGGLVAGVLATQRPDLFGAIISLSPLLDMLRYHKLLAGASWMDEYGNPDVPEERAALAAYSPYQNVREKGNYPPVLFITATSDDRVHPGHARKMHAKMQAQQHASMLYEDREGGHSRTGGNEAIARDYAMMFLFFAEHLGLR